ncbi:SMI1/KNR4 family protein [Parvimonas sp. C2]|nr:SMI1/KNR4 family protein [Parvimonas sp. C2]MEB3072766.1 SMI1/KNR4 family protein [Parvimonas sp. C2]
MLISKFNSVNNVGEQVEKKFNIKLPLSYIKFLDKYNGGGYL